MQRMPLGRIECACGTAAAAEGTMEVDAECLEEEELSGEEEEENNPMALPETVQFMSDVKNDYRTEQSIFDKLNSCTGVEQRLGKFQY